MSNNTGISSWAYGGFLSHRGTPESSISRWDFPFLTIQPLGYTYLGNLHINHWNVDGWHQGYVMHIDEIPPITGPEKLLRSQALVQAMWASSTWRFFDKWG